MFWSIRHYFSAENIMIYIYIFDRYIMRIYVKISWFWFEFVIGKLRTCGVWRVLRGAREHRRRLSQLQRPCSAEWRRKSKRVCVGHVQSLQHEYITSLKVGKCWLVYFFTSFANYDEISWTLLCHTAQSGLHPVMTVLRESTTQRFER